MCWKFTDTWCREKHLPKRKSIRVQETINLKQLYEQWTDKRPFIFFHHIGTFVKLKHLGNVPDPSTQDDYITVGWIVGHSSCWAISALNDRERRLPMCSVLINEHSYCLGDSLNMSVILSHRCGSLELWINSWQSMQQDIRLWFAAVCPRRFHQLNTYSKMSIARYKLTRANSP